MLVCERVCGVCRARSFFYTVLTSRAAMVYVCKCVCGVCRARSFLYTLLEIRATIVLILLSRSPGAFRIETQWVV